MAQPDTKHWDPLNRGAGAYSTPGVDHHKQEPEFVPRTASPVVRFKLHDVDPPSLVYVRPPDALNLHVISTIVGGDSVQFIVRILRSDGTITIENFRVASTVAGLGINEPVELPEGYLLSVIAATPTATFRGQTFVSATLRYLKSLAGSTVDILVLFAGYVTSSSFQSWPGGTLVHPIEGNGNIRSITGTVPAAGAEISEVVPTATRWRLIAFRYALTTAIAVANRESNLVIDDGVNTYITDTSGFTEAASLTDTFSWMLGVQRLQALQSNVLTLPLPPVLLPAGHRIRTLTTNIQAADQYAAPQYIVEEWLSNG